MKAIEFGIEEYNHNYYSVDMIKNLQHFRKYVEANKQFRVYGFFNGLDKVSSEYDAIIGKYIVVKHKNRRGFIVSCDDVDYWIPYPWGIGFSCERRLNKTVVILFRPGHRSGKHLILELTDE